MIKDMKGGTPLLNRIPRLPLPFGIQAGMRQVGGVQRVSRAAQSTRNWCSHLALNFGTKRESFTRAADMQGANTAVMATLQALEEAKPANSWFVVGRDGPVFGRD